MSNANLDIANTIARQIGQRAFFMLGAKDKVAIDDGLRFRIGRNSKGVTHVIVKLLPSDTYYVEFRTIRMGRLNKKTMERSSDINKLKSGVGGVYVDNLHAVIENGTGLATSL